MDLISKDGHCEVNVEIRVTNYFRFVNPYVIIDVSDIFLHVFSTKVPNECMIIPV